MAHHHSEMRAAISDSVYWMPHRGVPNNHRLHGMAVSFEQYFRRQIHPRPFNPTTYSPHTPLHHTQPYSFHILPFIIALPYTIFTPISLFLPIESYRAQRASHRHKDAHGTTLPHFARGGDRKTKVISAGGANRVCGQVKRHSTIPIFSGRPSNFGARRGRGKGRWLFLARTRRGLPPKSPCNKNLSRDTKKSHPEEGKETRISAETQGARKI